MLVPNVAPSSAAEGALIRTFSVILGAEASGFAATDEGGCAIVREPLAARQGKYVYFSDVNCTLSVRQSDNGGWEEVRRYKGARFVARAKVVGESSRHPLGVEVVDVWAANPALEEAASLFASALVVGVMDDPEFLQCSSSVDQAIAWLKQKFRISWTPSCWDRLSINGVAISLRTDYMVQQPKTSEGMPTPVVPVYKVV